MEKAGYLIDTINQVVNKNGLFNFRYFILMKEMPSSSLGEFISLANDTFWPFPSMQKFEPVEDGATWLIEGYVPEKGYHLVNRWSPNKNRDNQFRQLCDLLIEWAGIFKKRFIY